MHPVDALRRVAFLLERSSAPSFRVKAFRTAAAALARLDDDELARRARGGSLTDLPGVGATTARIATEALAGQVPAYLQRLEDEAAVLAEGGQELRAALRGDLHVHSDWSDGGSPVEEMALTAVELGHDYIALTDHSPRLTVAHGLSPERLAEQLDVVDRLNERLAPFRILSGIEVDITEDGGLDQTEELLGRLDVVVASVHSRLRADAAEMTRRMLGAVANPHTDVLGHCTGRLVAGPRSPRPESQFDADAVFAACAARGVAVEINSRPERLDPPMRLLRRALDAGCLFAVDTDAHAPGQLDWQQIGAARAQEAGVPTDRVVNTWDAGRLLAWTGRHTQSGQGQPGG
ncbi:PHP domain-containing protein [Quadrisphaera sp. GCM10027208]|uniref:PHP domain-containing protein n=1 Tax=Quadrisphaera sp. GCM10027208 TaxID=3273423 RepID=UPI0036166BF1